MARWVKNFHTYRNTLERIIEKYSKLDGQDGWMELDLGTASMSEMERCMKLSEVELSKMTSVLEQHSQGVSGTCSPALQDVYEDTQTSMDYDQGDDDDDDADDDDDDDNESALHANDCTMQNDAESITSVFGRDHTKLIMNPLNETQGSHWEWQPEDQDEELEKTLSSNSSSSLLEQYPSMLSQIGEAWRRQHVSEVAGSVLRRYHRMRWYSKRNNMNNCILNSTLRPAHSNTKINSGPVLQKALKTSRNASHSVTSNLKKTETGALAPWKTVRNWQVERKSPGKRSGSERVKQPRHPVPLNQTFTVSDSPPSASRPREEHTALIFSPTRTDHTRSGRYRSVSVFSVGCRAADPCLHGQRECTSRDANLSLPGQKESTGRAADPYLPGQRDLTIVHPHPMVSTWSPSIRESSSIFCSPSRQGPFRARPLPCEGAPASPNSHSRSPQSGPSGYRRSLTMEPMPAAASTSLYQPAMSPRKLVSRAYQSPSPSRLHSSQSPLLSSPKRFRRQARSSGGPTRGHSSSVLAALALSPYHSIKRKCHRELDQNLSPQSKRSRNVSDVHSPGSLRQRREMLRPWHGSSSLLPYTVMEPSYDYSKAVLARAHSSRHPSLDTQGKRAGDSKSGLQDRQLSTAWREEYYRFVARIQEKSSDRAEWKSGCSPRFSSSVLRRLLYK